MRLTIVGGCGYVGVITGLGFAELGHDVVGVDADEAKVEAYTKGKPLIFEPGLEEALRRALDQGRIKFTTDLEAGSRDADVVFVAVGSPAGRGGTADLSQIEAVALGLSQVVGHRTVIAIKSTVPVGTADRMRKVLESGRRAGASVDLVVNPEFLQEGRGYHDFFHPTRIVVGGGTDWARATMRRLYDPFTGSGEAEASAVDMAHGVPLIETSITDAQIVKYASNAFLATRLSFVNEIAAICERVGGDVAAVVEGLGHDPRIGKMYLQPGIGFGGPCLEKDLRALIESSRQYDYTPSFLEAVLERNQLQVDSVLEKARRLAGGRFDGKRVAVFGLAFKSGTNDVRTSLSMRIMQSLMREGAVVCGHDPVAIAEACEMLPDASYESDPYEAARDASALLVLTDWPEYRELDYERIGNAMQGRNIFDGRNLLNPAEMVRLGFTYLGVGR